jgi:hypothetical protein
MTVGPSPDPRWDDDPAREADGLVFGPRFDGDRGWRLRPSSPDWPAGQRPGELPDDEPPPDDEEDAWADGVDPEDLAVWLDDARMAALYAEAAQVTADAARARAVRERLGLTGAEAAVAAADRRGPGMPGSAKTYPGEYASRASSFASGMPLDVAAGCVTLGSFADEAAGDDDAYTGASDDELLGAICGWDRVQAHVAARKHAAVAEFIRRRAAAGYPLAGPARMPQVWDEFAPVELAAVLAESRWVADQLLEVAEALEVKLPGTKAALRDGIISDPRRPERQRDPGGFRREDQPDRSRRHPAGPGGPARGDRRDRAGRPRPGPRPSRGRRGQPEDHLVRDRHRPGRARHRARLRPA